MEACEAAARSIPHRLSDTRQHVDWTRTRQSRCHLQTSHWSLPRYYRQPECAQLFTLRGSWSGRWWSARQECPARRRQSRGRICRKAVAESAALQHRDRAANKMRW